MKMSNLFLSCREVTGSSQVNEEAVTVTEKATGSIEIMQPHDGLIAVDKLLQMVATLCLDEPTIAKCNLGLITLHDVLCKKILDTQRQTLITDYFHT